MFYQQSGELRYLQMVLRAKCMILSSLRNQFSQKSKLVLYCQTVYTWLLSVVWTSASIIKYHRIWMWLSSQNQESFCNCNQMFWCRPHGHMTWRHYWVVIRIRSRRRRRPVGDQNDGKVSRPKPDAPKRADGRARARPRTDTILRAG